jgi:hypothetical protein
MSNRRDSLRDSLGLLLLAACGKTVFDGKVRITASEGTGNNNGTGSPASTTGSLTETTNASNGTNLNNTGNVNDPTKGTVTPGTGNDANGYPLTTLPADATKGYRGITVESTDLCTPAESRGYVHTKKDTDKVLSINLNPDAPSIAVMPTVLTINRVAFYGKLSNACIALRFIIPQNTTADAPIFLVPGDTVQVLAPVSGSSMRAFVVARLEVTDYLTQDVIFDNLNLTGLTTVQIMVTRKEGTKDVRYLADLTLNFAAQFNGMDVVHALNVNDQSSSVQTNYYNNYPDLVFQIDSAGVNVGPKSTDNGTQAANLMQGNSTAVWSTNFTSSFGKLYDFFGNEVSDPTSAIKNDNYFLVYKTSTVDNKSYAFRYVFHFG